VEARPGDTEIERGRLSAGGGWQPQGGLQRRGQEREIEREG